MRKVLALIALVVLVTGGLVWWLLLEPESPSSPVADAPVTTPLEDPPFALSGGEEGATDAGVGRVSGRVVDEQGNPVEGARVRVYAERSELERLECGVCHLSVSECDDPSTVRKLIQGLRDGTIHASVPFAETLSAADGTFVFESVPRGGEVYAVLGERSAMGFSDNEGIDLLLEPPLSQSVLVVNGLGAPLPGVTVMVYSPREGTLTPHTSNADGVVTITALDHGSYVFAEREGSLPVGQLLMGAEQLMLSAPHTLIVRTRMGAQLVDAEVTIDLHHEARKLRTEKGLLRLEGLPQAYYTVAVASDALAAASQSVELLEPETQLDFQLRKGAKLLVTVLSPTGDPLEVVSGSISGIDGDASADAEQGALLILGPVPEGEYTLSLSSDGMVPVSRVVDLKPGETTLEVTMRAAPKLTGRVVTSDGKPVAQARVSAFEEDQEIAVSITGDEGEFELEFQYPGQFELRAEATRDGVAKAKTSVPGAPVTLTLEAKGVLEVEVFDADGTALEPDVLVRSEKDNSVRWVETDEASGKVGRVAGLPTGSYVIEKKLPERMPLHAQVEVVEGRVAHLKLKADLGATVRGKVVDHLGKPVAQASVVVSTRPDVTQTGDDGQFELKGVPPGPADVFGTHPSGAETNKLQITAPAQNLVLTVPEIARVTGRVVDEKGGAVLAFEANGQKVTASDGRFDVTAPSHTLDVWAEGYVSAFLTTAEGDVGDVVLKRQPEVEGEVIDVEGRPIGGANVQGSIDAIPITTDANGHFKLPINSEDPQDVIATRGSMSGRAPYRPGAVLRIVMSKGTTVVGKVIDATGKPVPTFVSAVSRDNSRPIEIDTDENGRFQLELSQGIWMFSSRSNRAARAVDVKGDRLELTLGDDASACSAVVRSTKTIDAVWFLTGPASESDGPWDLVNRQPGSVEVPVSTPSLEVVARSIPCGRYTLAASVENIVTSMSVELRQQGQVIEVVPTLAPEAPEAPEERAP
jgi:hypothetical protein